MGFSNSFGDYLCTLFIVFWVILLVAVKLLRAVDDDGSVQKTANDEFSAVLKRLFKK